MLNLFQGVTSALLDALIPHPYGLAVWHVLAICAALIVAIVGSILIALRNHIRTVGKVLAVLAVIFFLWAGTFAIERIYRQVASQAEEIAQARVAEEIATKTLQEWKRQHDAQIRALQELEDGRQADAIEARALNAKARAATRTIQKDFDHDAAEAARRLRARGAELNRLLEREAGRAPH